MDPSEADIRPATDIALLCAALNRVPEFGGVKADDLEPMRVKGLVHEHIRIRGRGVVVRVPHWSQFGFAPLDNLAYQTACFERAGPSGATPRLRAVVPICEGLPYGALVVDDIVGRMPRLPDDLPAMAECLSAIHSLPVPDMDARAPLYVHSDPVAGTLGFIRTQAAFLSEVGLRTEAMHQIQDEIAWAEKFAQRVAGEAQPITLVATDTHPANFLVEEGPTARAVFVDLEKALYGSPAIDLAHSSVYTSTMWDKDIAVALDKDQVAMFYRHYLDRVPTELAERLGSWLSPMRRLTWLRTTTWCAKWTVESAREEPATAQGGQASGWAARRRDPAMIAAVRARIADYFDPETIARIRSEWLGSGATGLVF